MKRLLQFGLLGALFVVVASTWEWAFLIDPYRPIPFVVRGLIALGLFGSTTFAAWTLLKQSVWPFAMAAAMLISLFAGSIWLSRRPCFCRLYPQQLVRFQRTIAR